MVRRLWPGGQFPMKLISIRVLVTEANWGRGSGKAGGTVERAQPEACWRFQSEDEGNEASSSAPSEGPVPAFVFPH